MFEMRFYPEGRIDWVYYHVEQRSKRFFGVSMVEHGRKVFITHREKSRQACKLAKLLAETYGKAYYDGAY